MTPVGRDPWAVLGVERGASLDDVRAARRRLAKQVHPDHGGDASAMRELNAAFDEIVRAILNPKARPGDVAAPASGGPPPSQTGTAAGTGTADRRRRERGRPRRGVEHDTPSFTIDVLPAEAFEALLVVASWIGELLVDDPPYLLDVHLHEPAPCWCRLDLLPEAGSTSVSLTVGPVGDAEAPSAEAVRDVWIAQLNRL